VPWITEEDKISVIEALNSRWLTGGPKTSEFEKLFADFAYFFGRERFTTYYRVKKILHVTNIAGEHTLTKIAFESIQEL